MSRQYWVAPLSPLQTADGTAYNTSVTLTDVSPTPNIVLPANLLEVGSTLRFEAILRYSTTGTPTLLLGVYYGGVAGVAIAATAALTTPSGVTNNTAYVRGSARVRSVGATGTILGAISVEGVSGATALNLGPATAPATATIDTTTAKSVTLGAQWGTSSASNTLTVHHFSVELLG